jgi:hypothetical protein
VVKGRLLKFAMQVTDSGVVSCCGLFLLWKGKEGRAALHVEGVLRAYYRLYGGHLMVIVLNT